MPSSKAQGSTVKQLLQLLRRDFLPIPLLLRSGLNPPKRGAPGVPGVTGVEGADGTSSLLSISCITPIKKTERKEKGKFKLSVALVCLYVLKRKFELLVTLRGICPYIE